MAKVMVSLPDELLAQLDAEAKRRSTTRSGLLADAVRRELASPSVEARRQILARMGDGGPFRVRMARADHSPA